VFSEGGRFIVRLRVHVRSFIVLAVIAAGFTLVPSARGATCTVPSTGYPTINSATGDPSCTVIQLGKGPFYENVTVPNPGVTIVGKGGECGEKPQTIIDAAPGGVNATGTHVQADNVTIKNLVIRHGTAGVHTDNANTKVINICTFGHRENGDNSAGVFVVGDNATVKKSEFHSLDGSGVFVINGSSGATITGNSVHNVGTHCIKATDGTVTISGNKLRACDDQGIRTENDADVTIEDNVITSVDRGIEHTCCGDITARGNKITNAQDKGIQADGDGVRTVSQNTVVSSRNRCIQSEGDGNTSVTSNTCQYTGGIGVRAPDPVVSNNVLDLVWESHGFRIECQSTCADAEIVGNSMGGASRDHNGFEFDADGPGGLVQNNVSIESGNAGFRFNDVDDWTIDSNQAIRSGQREGGDEKVGFRFSDSSDNDITNNLATAGRDDGFAFMDNSSNNTISGNTASNNVKDGFDLFGGGEVDNVFDGNTAKGNHAEGFENDGTTTDFTNNIAKKNRWDCNWFDGTEDVVSGNTCADGLDPNVLPPQGEID
jgi:parallel beta-helix repeat protein